DDQQRPRCGPRRHADAARRWRDGRRFPNLLAGHTMQHQTGNCACGSRPMSGARVVLVEDKPQMRKSVSMILGGHGYDVAQASSGEEALQEFARRLPDVILLDLMLPD